MPSETPPHCALDATGARDQGARYAQLAPAVATTERAADRLTVTFGPELDRDLLEEALEVERRCCPFFTLEFDQAERRLRVGVSQAEHAPALDALAAALGSGAAAL